MKVAAQRDRAFLVSGIDEPVEALGGIGAHRKQPDVIDLDQIGAQDAADGLGDGVISAVATYQRTELFEAKPRHVHPGFDGLLAEGFEQKRLAGA